MQRFNISGRFSGAVLTDTPSVSVKQSSKDSDDTLTIIHHQKAKGTEKSFFTLADNIKHCVF